MPEDPEVQMCSAFDKIGYVLHDAGLTFGAIDDSMMLGTVGQHGGKAPRRS